MEKISASDIDSKLSNSEYVIFDFSSPGCAPCKKVPPLIEDILKEFPDVSVSAFEIDVAESPEAAQKYFILGVPTIIVFRNGNEIKRFNSIPKKEKIKELII